MDAIHDYVRGDVPKGGPCRLIEALQVVKNSERMMNDLMVFSLIPEEYFGHLQKVWLGYVVTWTPCDRVTTDTVREDRRYK